MALYGGSVAASAVAEAPSLLLKHEFPWVTPFFGE